MAKYYFRFEKRQVDRLEMDVLLEVFNVEQISNYALGEYFGAVQIEFGGYTRQDPHPILVPELRQFLRHLAKRWGPGSAVFFTEWHSPFLLLYLTAQLDNLKILERPSTDEFVLFHRPEELVAVEQAAFAGLEKLVRRAGLSASVMDEHQKIISKLLAGMFCHQRQGK
jgi:hypothetical protein